MRILDKALFRKKRFLVNLKTERNASKFAIFMEKENPCSFFRFSFRATFIFPLWMLCHECYLWNKLRGFSFSIHIANFEAFLSVFKLTKNLFFLKSVLGRALAEPETRLGLDPSLVMMLGWSLGAIPNGALMKSFPFRWNSFGADDEE